MQNKTFSPPGQRAFAARFEAQKIAFGPVVFQCVHYAWKRGVLQALADAGEAGRSVDDLAATGRWSAYALKVVLESCLSAGVVALAEGRYQLDKTGWCVLSDEITRINFDFVQDVCYQGLFDLGRSLDEQRPHGLKALGDWPTLYEGMATLPEPARSSWFAFDHHYSDTSFPEILPDVLASAPRRVMDIGANTGKFACALLAYDPK
ncbi:SAM-dependent methyltransferase, partial [Rubrivivax gelatinosus]|nr:SAM-dependent methyltransferase [Rubrivivax gelatinosus]